MSCRLNERDGPLPPEPPIDECGIEWVTHGVYLSEQGLDDGLCDGNPPLMNATVLPYGAVLRFGDYGCISEEVGVTCAHLPSGRAMRVAREEISTFLLR